MHLSVEPSSAAFLASHFSHTPGALLTSRPEWHYRRLVEEAAVHSAVNHQWLNAVAEHQYPDMHKAIVDFALEYNGYSAAFPDYLSAVIKALDCREHQALLQHNLEEEKGHMDLDDQVALTAMGINPDTVVGVPHPQLFRRFCYAMGLSDDELKRPTEAATKWRNQFRTFLTCASPAAAVGALGLGTENVVKPIYQKMLLGLGSLKTIQREDYVFFELHCTVDDQHALDLKNIALSLLGTDQGYQEMRLGMNVALNLRNEFFNHLHRCASAMKKAV